MIKDRVLLRSGLRFCLVAFSGVLLILMGVGVLTVLGKWEESWLEWVSLLLLPCWLSGLWGLITCLRSTSGAMALLFLLTGLLWLPVGSMGWVDPFMAVLPSLPFAVVYAATLGSLCGETGDPRLVKASRGGCLGVVAFPFLWALVCPSGSEGFGVVLALGLFLAYLALITRRLAFHPLGPAEQPKAGLD